ncbi:unnamed protein product [Gongylonema pulchrum]|uniref:Secreted protein n=1 Tax=Gongylonema pulchrum TaxID=637853 RepID=A0A183ETN5_9BILA|nr:unnamed protein product [Gongylonema pulchrum]
MMTVAMTKTATLTMITTASVELMMVKATSPCWSQRDLKILLLQRNSKIKSKIGCARKKQQRCVAVHTFR